MADKSLSSSQRGFSLIELLCVVAIIGIIAAIAIPYLVQAKQAANGASAVSSLRLINSCEASYRAANNRYGDLAALSNERYLNDPSLQSGRKSHYLFDVAAGDPALGPVLGSPTLYYRALATPANEPARWQHFFIDATGVIRASDGAAATAASLPYN